MTDLFFQGVASNVLISFALAIMAVFAGISKRFRFVHILWLLVLIKLVTPPLVSIPVATITEPVDRSPSPW
jgi:ABC-type glycerol-3-phosphate transport system permease component